MIKIHLSRILGEQRITQADLSRKTGIRANTINEWYHDIIDRVSLTHLSAICKALHCTPSDLLEYIPNQTANKCNK